MDLCTSKRGTSEGAEWHRAAANAEGKRVLRRTTPTPHQASLWKQRQCHTAGQTRCGLRCTQVQQPHQVIWCSLLQQLFALLPCLSGQQLTDLQQHGGFRLNPSLCNAQLPDAPPRHCAAATLTWQRMYGMSSLRGLAAGEPPMLCMNDSGSPGSGSAASGVAAAAAASSATANSRMPDCWRQNIFCELKRVSAAE